MAPTSKPKPIPDAYRRVTPCLIEDESRSGTPRRRRPGATLKRPPQDQFYGDRDGYVVDPFGHGWTIATHVEDVVPEEMARRMAELCGHA